MGSQTSDFPVALYPPSAFDLTGRPPSLYDYVSRELLLEQKAFLTSTTAAASPTVSDPKDCELALHNTNEGSDLAEPSPTSPGQPCPWIHGHRPVQWDGMTPKQGAYHLHTLQQAGNYVQSLCDWPQLVTDLHACKSRHPVLYFFSNVCGVERRALLGCQAKRLEALQQIIDIDRSSEGGPLGPFQVTRSPPFYHFHKVTDAS